MKVLLVEDDRAIREVVAEFLELSGCEVETAADGAEGMAAALANTPDVILLDLGMPVVDGFAFRRSQLAGELASVPTVVITASYTDDAELAALRAPVLRKPLDFDELLAAVTEAAAKAGAA